MSALSKSSYVSPEEYLLGENDRPDGKKYEYVNGQIYAMAGASRGHNLLAGNCFLALALHLRGSRCQVFQSEMKVEIQTLNDTRYYYPDVQVSCEDETASHFNQSPCLVAAAKHFSITTSGTYNLPSPHKPSIPTHHHQA